MARNILRPGDYWLQSEYAANPNDSRLSGPVRIERILDRRVLIMPVTPAGVSLLAVLGFSLALLRRAGACDFRYFPSTRPLGHPDRARTR